MRFNGLRERGFRNNEGLHTSLCTFFTSEIFFPETVYEAAVAAPNQALTALHQITTVDPGILFLNGTMRDSPGPRPTAHSGYR